ncbi:MAG: hypothetical protein HY550_06975 [Elusimicrobia bacterium]|nr:hypothetical protein [Elusimicrobiota bacterium]
MDPEALLLFTCTIARSDPRLFDEVLDWLGTNGELINVQRLKMIMTREGFSGRAVLAAMAETIGQGYRARKWKSLFGPAAAVNRPEPLFYSSDDIPLEHFGDADRTFLRHGLSRGKIKSRGQAAHPRYLKSALILRLRALFGVTVRPEIVAYLFAHESAHPSIIARETYFSQKAVQDAMVEMSRSGVISVRTVGREKRYRLDKASWASLLKAEPDALIWSCRPPLFSALERVWLKLNSVEFQRLDALLTSSVLRALMAELRPAFEQAGFGVLISDDKAQKGEQYTQVFLSDMERVLKKAAGA